jgi:hypothetical protein
MVKVNESLSEIGTPHNSFQGIQVIATSQFVPYVTYMDNPARVVLYETLDGEDMKVAVNANRSCAHNGTKEGYLAFHTSEKGAVVVDCHHGLLDRQILDVLQNML